MRSFTILFVAIVLAASAVGCKWSFGSNTEVSNSSSNSNRSRTNSNSSDDDYASSSPTPDPDRDMTPLSLSVSDMVEGSGDEENVGRMATVTGGVLENISSDQLRIRGPYNVGAAFYCKGDFSEYMSMASKVESLSQSGKSPKVTVKGIYKIATTGSGGELNPCVLSDIEKP